MQSQCAGLGSRRQIDVRLGDKVTPKQRPLFICQILMNYGVLQFLELLHNSDLSLLLNTFLSARYAFYYCIFLGGGGGS